MTSTTKGTQTSKLVGVIIYSVKETDMDDKVTRQQLIQNVTEKKKKPDRQYRVGSNMKKKTKKLQDQGIEV